MTSTESTEEPTEPQYSFLDPEAPIGRLATFVASLLTAVMTLIWWFLLRVGHCGLDFGGGPPPPPRPSNFGQNDLWFALIGAAVVVAPVLLARLFSEDEGQRVATLRVALVAFAVIALVTLRHFSGGADYWPNSC